MRKLFNTGKRSVIVRLFFFPTEVAIIDANVAAPLQDLIACALTFDKQ